MHNPLSTAPWDSRTAGAIKHDASFYGKCMLGGVLACGTTHAVMTPIDVAKCNMQVNPLKYNGLMSTVKTLLKEEGATGIWKGFGPTLVGYSAQGMFKFGLYEVFKDQYANLAGKENAQKYKSAIWLAGSASAEVFADIALCPFEMTKVKIQTSPVGTFPTAFGAAITAMSKNRVETKYPFGSLVPLWSRQIPYTMAKFFFFEKIVQAFYTHVLLEPKSTYNLATQLSVTFASGYLSGIVCAVVSHPADSLVSLMGKPANKGKSIGTIASEVGAMALCTKGLPTRVLMIGTLTGLQWYIYDTFKGMMGLGTSGGK